MFKQNTNKKVTFIIFGFFYFFTTLCGQIATGVTKLNDSTSYNSIKLPTLDSLITLAKVNSLMQKKLGSVLKNKKLELQIEKREWLKNISLSSDVRYGMGESYLISQAANGQLGSDASVAKQLRYNFGAALTIPFSTIFQEPKLIEKKKGEILQAQLDQEISFQELRQTIIKQYNLVILNKSVFDIYQNNLNSTQLRLSMAEKQFATGLIKMNDYMTLVESLNNAQINFEKAKFELLVSYQILMDIVNINKKEEN